MENITSASPRQFFQKLKGFSTLFQKLKKYHSQINC